MGGKSSHWSSNKVWKRRELKIVEKLEENYSKGLKNIDNLLSGADKLILIVITSTLTWIFSHRFSMDWLYRDDNHIHIYISSELCET